jgi:hypothetical protein
MRGLRPMTAILAAALLTAPLIGAAQTARPAGATYQWSGEFVSADTATSTMTVKARVAYQEAISELKHFKAGDRVWVAWSGVQDYSDAVRQIRRVQPGGTIDEHLVMPAELVSTEAPNQYATIRVKVPRQAWPRSRT